MREELKQLVCRLQEVTGARPFVLPPPYARGHFRLYGAHALNHPDFTAHTEGKHTFVTLTSACLECTLRQMDADVPALPVYPERSPLDTLLYQILAHGFEPDGLDCPELARLCLDLDKDPARSKRVIAGMQPQLQAHYAACLRTGRRQSMLPAVARQIVFYRQMVMV